MWLLRSRFIEVEQTLWQRLTSPIRRLKSKARRALRNASDRLLAGRRERAYLDRNYPFLSINAPQPGQWIDDPASPNGRSWDGQRNWRTRIGPAVVCWECGAPAYRAWNVRMPDGMRCHVRQRRPHWRRPAKPPLAWLYGTLVFHAGDIEFVDLIEQPRYSPPDRSDIPNLEAELARLPAFTADLGDDAFAMTAFYMLAKREWMKIGHHEVETFLGDSWVADMIAGLRAKGEDHLDVKYGTLSGRNREVKRGVFSEDHVHRLHRHLASIGWRTHTPDEIQAILREELLQRLRTWVGLLRQIKEMELRRAGSFPHWKEAPRYPPFKVSIFREGDDPAWLGVLSPEEQEACSAELALRISTLAVSARIDQDEHEKLVNALVR